MFSTVVCKKTKTKKINIKIKVLHGQKSNGQSILKSITYIYCVAFVIFRISSNVSQSLKQLLEATWPPDLSCNHMFDGDIVLQ